MKPMRSVALAGAVLALSFSAWVAAAGDAKKILASATPPPPAVSARHGVNITESIAKVEFTFQGQTYLIDRIQDEDHEISGSFAKTSRKCPPFCIHPMRAAPGVVTVGELELLEFLKTKVERRVGMLIDARAESWYVKGTIPGSINIPFTTFGADEDDPKLQSALKLLGVEKRVQHSGAKTVQRWVAGADGRKYQWDFSRAKEILLFCNGPWCDQSPRAIQDLLRLGYPANKMYYYRGGMQDWLVLGLSVYVPPSATANAKTK